MKARLKRGEALFLTCYSAFIVATYVFGEIFNKPRAMWLIYPILAVGIFSSVVLNGKQTAKNLLLRLVIILVFCGAAIASSKPQVIVYSALLCGADMTSFRKICKCSLFFCTASVLVTMMLYFVGILPDGGQWYRFGVHIKTFGFGYYSIVPYTFFYMVIIYLYLKYNNGKKASWVELIIIVLLNYLLYSVTTLRLTYYLNYLTLFMYIILIKFDWFDLRNKIINLLTILIFPALFALSIWINFSFTYSNPTFFQLNRLLSNRLALGHEGLQRYNINLFGNFIETNNSENMAEYFYIDSGFLFSVLGYGLLFTGLLLIIYIYMHNYSACTNNKMLFIWLTIVAIFSTTNNTWITIQFNPIVLMFPLILKETRIKESTKLMLNARNRKYITD